jgi:hypothetical protein
MQQQHSASRRASMSENNDSYPYISVESVYFMALCAQNWLIYTESHQLLAWETELL